MIKVMFVCLGNICRSPMAEFVFRDMLKKEGLQDKIFAASSATSREEIGNSVHPGTRKKLASVGISTDGKYAVQLTASDFEKYDLIIGMESANIRAMQCICNKYPEKVYKLLDFADSGDIADPWYTGNFDVTYDAVCRGCRGLLEKLKREM